ncbi:hypothetical protein [Xylophilus sp. GOD-11R]|uniref:hypothetical protein n=1 Tax=Xylophilus sp. GOD-11R TaxID=3089814 RepID=UPI00298D4A83|nr:hypothetical protein [Xylophilus sp. GOD-11R]WPB59002.1 hypothetical protein R9X41_10330 [Xylophilus sp. GOD-11R]
MPASDGTPPDDRRALRRFLLAAAIVAVPVLGLVGLLNTLGDPFGYRGRPLAPGLNDVRSQVFYRAARPTQMHWLRSQAVQQNRQAELLVGTSRVVRGFDACAHPRRGVLALPLMSQEEIADLVRDKLPPPDFEQTLWIEIARGPTPVTAESYGSAQPSRDDLLSWNATVTSIDNALASRFVPRKAGGAAGCAVVPLHTDNVRNDSVGLLRAVEADPLGLPSYRDLLMRIAPACGPKRHIVLVVLPAYVAPESWDEALSVMQRYDRKMSEETERMRDRYPGCRFEFRDLATRYLERGAEAQQADVRAGYWADGVHFSPELGEAVLASGGGIR